MSDPSVEDSIEIETISPKVCKHIKAENLGFSSGYSTLKIETLTASEGEGVATAITIEGADELEVPDVTPQIGRVVNFTTPADGKALIQVKFTSPTWRGDVTVRSASDSKIRTEPIYLRQPRPAPQTS
jgi:hypothetical protein